jgi:hypothetical protein
LEEFSWKLYEGNYPQLKRLLEGKEFSVDVKCRDPRVLKISCPVICVSNEWFLGDASFERRFEDVNATLPCWQNGKKFFEVKEEVVSEGEEEDCITLSSDTAYSRLSIQEPLPFLPSSSSIVLEG